MESLKLFAFTIKVLKIMLLTFKFNLYLFKNLIDIKKISNEDNIYLKYKNSDAYFFKVDDKNYNNNSLVIYGDKGKIEISSRPESCMIYKKKKDNLYKNYFLLKKFKKINLTSNEIQKSVLDNTYGVLKK